MVGDGGQIPLTGEQVKCVSPKIAYGPSGVLYYLYQAARAPGSKPRQVLITTSHDGGVTFGAPMLLGSMTDRFVYAQVAIAVDQTSGRVYAAWTDKTDPNSERILVASSPGQGQTFSAPVQASPPNQQYPEGPEEPSLVVDSDHALHVGWRVFPTDQRHGVLEYVAVSRDHGQSFGSPSLALSNLDAGCAGGTPECRRPVLYAADNVAAQLARGTSRGQLFTVGWGPEGGVRTNNRRLFFPASRDGGATWSPEKVLGIPAGHQSDDQARPSLTVTPSGRIEIVYQNISTTEGGFQNIFESHSDDGGSTFSVPRQLNAAASDIRVGPPSFSTFNGGNTAGLGAHSAVASSGSAVFTAWTDTSRGTLDTGKQDIFFAALPLPAPSVTHYRLTNHEFVVGRGRTPRLGHAASSRRHRTGTTFLYTLSEAATVKIVIAQRLPGRRHGKRCVAPTRRLRRARRCTRIAIKGTLTRTSAKGVNRVEFSGRIGTKALTPGFYRATLVATDAGGLTSKPETILFTIIQR